jgi:hypothetical protein
MKDEMESIVSNKTWTLCELLKGQKSIGLKWVYKLKKDSSGKVVKHKARLVAKGYVQCHGIDYDEVFAPIARLEIVRMLLALAAQWGMGNSPYGCEIGLPKWRSRRRSIC